MSDNKKKLFVDSSTGGNGDIWMRLVSFYAVSALVPDLKLHLLIPPFLRNLARFTFGDRLVIVENEDFSGQRLKYTTLGLKDLVTGIIKGDRYISPYQRAVIHDKKKRQLKDLVNISLFNVCNYFGWVNIPDWKWIETYQGYLEISGIKGLKQVGYEDYLSQLQKDYNQIFIRLNTEIPISKELRLPEDFGENIVVFPTGTSRQFVPVSWAKEHLPNAYFAFFFKDKDAEVFQRHGLKTVLFFHEPGDIIFLSRNAKWTVSTDSFPSHLLQYSSKKCTVTITEVLKSRIISPVFKGKVIDSEVACHPCLHLDRKNHPHCMAGFSECQNWANFSYTQNLLNSIP